MRQWKGDTDIGFRAHAEVLRLFPKMTDAHRVLGMRGDNLNAWGKGVCPSAKYLARLHRSGADVVWILTGERSRSV